MSLSTNRKLYEECLPSNFQFGFRKGFNAQVVYRHDRKRQKNNHCY